MRLHAIWALSFLASFIPGPAVAEEGPLSPAEQDRLKTALSSQLAQEDEALAREPDSISHLSRRGDTHLFRGELLPAVADYEKMIRLDPSQDGPHWRLGIAYYLSEKWEKASRQFAKYHTYDDHDRENGVWKFFSDWRWRGRENARTAMLAYNRFDREPFPALYELLAGQFSLEAFWRDLAKRQISQNREAAFFANYYGGLYEFESGEVSRGLPRMREAVALYQLDEASRGGPGFMWQVARVHYALLQAKTAEAELAAKPAP